MASEFTINKAYAEKYNTWRAKEELQRLKDKYGDVDINNATDSSSSSESEDENAEALTAQLEKDWLKTLSALKSKDPKIYKEDAKFFHSEDDDEEGDDEDSKPKKKKQKPVFLKDYERKLITEKDGQVTSDSDDNYQDDEPDSKPGYYKEQEEIRESFKSAGFDCSDESSDDEFLTKRKKSKLQKAEEEVDYLNWLKGQKSKLAEDKVGVELESLKDYWSNPNLDSGEKFLRDYILNKGHIDKESGRIPTYSEVVDDEDEDFSEEEGLLDQQEEFERKYNFRFEEPDQEFIKSYPRTIKDTVRRKDSTRAEKRQEIKERKKTEKDTRKEEIKQLKNLKKKEIQDKIEKLKMITGNPSLGFNDDDLNDDFDPKKHDEMMKKYFDDDYYDEEGAEDTKPDVGFVDEDLETETWDTWEGGTENDNGEGEEENDGGPHVDDEDFNMDADYDPTQAISKKQKKKSKLTQALNKSKPTFDPEEKTFEQYLDDYYQLDCEDVIGDMPCRFKYRQVTPNDYGLGVDEILKCKDKELNSWVSLKKISQYTTAEEEEEEVRVYRNKGKNQKKKCNLLTSLQEYNREEEEKTSKDISEEKKKKKRQKKKNKKAKDSASKVSVIGNANSFDGKRKAEVDQTQPKKKIKLETSPVKQDKSQVKLENSPVKLGKSQVKLENSPVKLGKSQVKLENSPVKLNKSRVKLENSPVKRDKSQVRLDNSPEKLDKSPLKLDRGLIVDNSVKQKKEKTKVKSGEKLSDSASFKTENDLKVNNVSSTKNVSFDTELVRVTVCDNSEDKESPVTSVQTKETSSSAPATKAGDSEAASGTGEQQKMSKRKRKNRKKKLQKGVGNDTGDKPPAEKQKTKKIKNKLNIKKPTMTDERLLAYGIDPKKYKYMQLKKYAYEES
ncbi:protein KRI1 homolog [Mizuhopecten yessoensis]|uniref:Protein KRI1 homolog n=1 Tax=Mizuhopecten yessoensis TaxID=6573 RepID=A0A210QGN1_MIZYE|nr:protein KRI1 homolog [Mizuhopecten yessoensis]OWF47876.1 Protein KRI1-like [Mizuhopecten yessoensis]